MGGFRRLGMLVLGCLAVSIALAGAANSDEGQLVPQPCPCLTTSGPPYCERCLTSPDCRQCGGVPQPDLAIPSDCWPPPCRDIQPCDPLQTCCPSKDEFYLVPPRPWLYAVAEGGAICRRPVRSVDMAAIPVLLDGSLVPVNIALSTSNFNYDFAAMGRGVVGCSIGECFQIEGVYQGVSQSENMAAVRNNTPNEFGGEGILLSPFGYFGIDPVLGLDYNNLAQIRYTSSLQSIELNVRRKMPLQPERLSASILFGVRYIGLPEDFNYLTESDVNSGGTIAPSGATNNIHVRTTNDMIGPQIGALFEFYCENRWWVNFEMKAAVLNNRARQSTAYHNVDAGVVHDYAGTCQGDHTAFAGDLNLAFVYRWSPHFSTRLGYQALWLTNQALAPDNLNTDIDILTQGPAQLNHSAGTLYHGPFAGVTLGW